jgi:hypothetical protein
MSKLESAVRRTSGDTIAGASEDVVLAVDLPRGQRRDVAIDDKRGRDRASVASRYRRRLTPSASLPAARRAKGADLAACDAARCHSTSAHVRRH